MPTEFPPFELQASKSTLLHLTSGISGWRVDRLGSRILNVWLKASDGTTLLVGVDQRDVRPLFEVFTLSLFSMGELNEQWKRWTPPVSLEGIPDGLRTLFTTRPAAPVKPTEFEAWPLRSWRTEVARRAEFIVEDANVGPTFGSNPNSQSAARPQAVPHDASASCEVAAGVLFTGEDRQLLLAVDWMPMNMLVSEDPAEITAFLKGCELVSMADYLDW